MITENSILLSVCNRDIGFVSAGVLLPGGFVAAPETPEEREVRELLRLNDRTTDYFVKGVLQAIDAFPNIRANFLEQTRTYNWRFAQRIPDYLDGADLLPNQAGTPYILRHPTEWPVQFVFEFRRQDSAHMSVVYRGRKEFIPVHETPEGLFVEWPAWLNMNGTLYPKSNPFDANFLVTLSHEPVTYPYDIVAGLIANNKSCEHLVRRQGLGNHFYYAATPAEKVAVAALALGLCNERVYP